MSDYAIIRAREHKVMRWKNGGGETAEIAASPIGAGLDNFDWRLSMAKVETDGPFSAFPGVDRTLSILEGEGIQLSVAGEPMVAVTKAAAPHSFPADAETSAALIGGSITDLNMMSRRGRIEHSVERVLIEGDGEVAFSDGEAIVFCAEGTIELMFGENVVNLCRHDTLVRRAEPCRILVRGSALIYLVSLRMLP